MEDKKNPKEILNKEFDKRMVETKPELPKQKQPLNEKLRGKSVHTPKLDY